MFRAIVLAAGKSRRMGEQDKLLLPFGTDKTIIEQVLTPLVALSSQIETVVVCRSAAVRDTVAVVKPQVKVVYSPTSNKQSDSLKAGLENISPNIKGLIFVLGDQPLVTKSIYENLMSSYTYLYNIKSSRNIVVPCFPQTRGNPVLLSIDYLTQLKNITGDMGARQIIDNNRHKLFRIKLENAHWVNLDVDTFEQYKSLLAFKLTMESRVKENDENISKKWLSSNNGCKQTSNKK